MWVWNVGVECVECVGCGCGVWVWSVRGRDTEGWRRLCVKGIDKSF